MLTDHQQTAFDLIVNTFEKDSLFLLTGCGGVGKSFLCKYIADYYVKLNYSIAAISFSHKARRVLGNFLNNKRVLHIPTFTVASFLGKLKEHSYIGTKTYSNPNAKKFNQYKLFILDEISMVADQDLRFIIDYVKKNNKKLLMLGDVMQIPSITNGYSVVNDIVEKNNTFVFTDAAIPTFELTEIVRQKKDSPILELTSYVRNNMDIPFDVVNSGYKNIIGIDEAYEKYIEYFKQYPTSCKIITYTNQSVKRHNLEIRKCMGYTKPLVVNDLLTGYTNLGWPEILIENGRDYVITSVKYTNTHVIEKFSGLSGYLVDLLPTDTQTKIPNMFFIQVHDENNYDFMQEVMKRGERVNQRHSSKLDYLSYNALKYKVLFIDDLYKFNGEIYSELDFKESHAMLFTKMDEVVKDKQLIHSKLTEKINTSYENIIQHRLLDDKIISESETLADQFKVIEKDIYYGYSINSHRSQGSTYDSVFVDEQDFAILNDRFNFRYSMIESKLKERNQLRYVAYSRSREHLYIIN